MTKPKRDPLVHRPDPTLTPHEIIAKNDARNMLTLIHDLTAYMPPSCKARLRESGVFQVRLGEYQVQITLHGRFEAPTEKYGRVHW